jgi:hypothetical protein
MKYPRCHSQPSPQGEGKGIQVHNRNWILGR